MRAQGALKCEAENRRRDNQGCAAAEGEANEGGGKEKEKGLLRSSPVNLLIEFL